MPRNVPQSHDEQVVRIALDRLVGEAQGVAAQRGLPPDLRYTTPEEELALYNQWDDKVDPIAVMQERFAKHTQDGLPPEMAMAEAIVETCAAGFSNRLRLAGGAGRITLAAQAKYLESMAMKSRRAREKELPPTEGTDETMSVEPAEGPAPSTLETGEY